MFTQRSILFSGLMRHATVILAALAVLLIQGPAYIFKLWDHLPGHGDSFINSWILAWNAHALFEPSLSVWDAPIYYPVSKALTFSETMFGNLWLTIPIQWISGNAIFTSNMLFMSSFILCTYCVYLLVHEHTGNYWASLIAGLVFSFHPYRWFHAGHLQLQPIYWSALALLFANRFMTNNRRSDLLITLFFTWVQYYASIYLGTMLLILLFILSILHHLFEKNRFAFIRDSNIRNSLIIGFVLSALVLLPLALPYIKTAQKWKFYRSLSENAIYSAEPLSFFLRPVPSVSHFKTLPKILPGKVRQGEASVFLGTVVFVLMTSALFLFYRKKDLFSEGQISSIKKYSWAALIMAIFMMGPYLVILNHTTNVPLPYQLLYHFFPGVQAMRVPARFFQPLLLCICVMGGFAVFGYLKLTDHWGAIKQLIIPTLFIGLWAYDYNLRHHSGTKVEKKEDIPPVYYYLKQSDMDGAVLELPIGIGQLFDYRYLHYQTFHWRPILGGWTGQMLPGRKDIALRLNQENYMPTKKALSIIQTTPANILVTHLNLLSPEANSAWTKVSLESIGFEPKGRIGKALIWIRTTPYKSFNSRLSVKELIWKIDKNELVIDLILKTDKPWRNLDQKYFNTTFLIMRSDGVQIKREAQVELPPYLMPGESKTIKVALDNWKETQIQEIRIESLVLEMSTPSAVAD